MNFRHIIHSNLISVSIIKKIKLIYSENTPYHPGVMYPEIEEYRDKIICGNENKVYESIRESFVLLGMDKENIGSDKWNPLRDIIDENDTVLLNPNFVSHKVKQSDDWDYCITHGSVIRAVIDYVYLALNGTGRIIIADGPQTDSDIDKILELTGVREIQKFYKEKFDYEVEFIDFRDEKWTEQDGVITGKEKLEGDPAGSIIFDLGDKSSFAEIDKKNPSYYGAHYDISETMSHHTNGRHEYCICRTPIEADVFINIPKLKTHKKCGITVNLKSLVGGVNANKNYLPHYIIGSPETGGDQFNRASVKSRLENKVVLRFKKLLLKDNKFLKFVARRTKKAGYKIFGKTENVIRSGNWHGNDTVWRMCMDLNKILFYGEPDGKLNPGKRKKYFCVVDGIKSMEGDGPTSGKCRNDGLIISGYNPSAVDAVCATVMGFDYKKIPLIKNSFEEKEFPLTDFTYEDIICISNDERFNKKAADIKYEDTLKYEPHFGWKGYIEQK